jgi:hypothetical protein
MTTVYLGSLSIGGAVPGVQGAIVNALGDVQARVTAVASFVPSITPPSISADIQTNAQILANLNAAATFGIEPPSLDLQVSILASSLLLLKAQLDVILDLMNAFGSAGVHAYTYDGTASGLGAEFSTELAAGFPGGAPSDPTHAILLATTIPATWAAMSQIFKVTP